MGLSTYSIFMKGSSKVQLFSFRKSVVQEAQVKGIKPTARHFGIARNTVRDWLRRFETEGNKGLEDKRKGPNNIPHKTSKEEEKKVLEARNQAPCYGARRLKYFFNLNCSIGAIHRILKDNGLIKKRKKKYQKKNDLREYKAAYKSFTHLQMDLKHLRDMPNYWGQIKKFNLPSFQYTIRDVKSGMLFLGFSSELSELNARTMIDYVLTRLKAQMPDKIIVQTDNGVEFSGTCRHFERSTFSQEIASHSSEHKFIPPGMCNANGDVESSHHLIEEEFYNLVKVSSREDFLKKAESYRMFFNLERPNYSKKGKAPWLIAQQDWPDSNLASHAALIATIDLDKISKNSYNLEGQTIPNSAGY